MEYYEEIYTSFIMNMLEINDRSNIKICYKNCSLKFCVFNKLVKNYNACTFEKYNSKLPGQNKL